MRLKLCIILLFTSLLNACVSAPQSAALKRQTDLESVTLSDLPFFSQSAYQCGPAALATLLVSSQVSVTPSQLVPQVYVPERKGSFQVEMMAAARSYGRIAYPLAPELNAVFEEVEAGNPVLVLQNLGLSWMPRWHFAVVKGFDINKNKILLNSGTIENYELSIATFERTWARSNYWAMITLQPGTMPATADPETYYIALAALEQTNPDQHVAIAYHSGLSAWPTDRNLLMAYGNTLYIEGNTKAAAEQYEAVIKHHSDYAPAWNNLAEIFIEDGDKEKALLHVRKAIELGGPFMATYEGTLQKINQSN